MKDVDLHVRRRFLAAMAMLMLLSLPALAQKIKITGTVLDEEGSPIVGASVLEKGTSKCVSTDIDGNFMIEVPSEATLRISYIGYETVDVPVAGKRHLEISMKENSSMLAETVVVGYGSVKKYDATGAVGLVIPDEVEAGISASVQNLLVGASPGVVVTSDGGSPEGGATIRIRGGSSLSASNAPLIVFDGVPLADDAVQGMSNPLAMISPDNIESITILKDASATAIYGSRASNGVIIINSKRGRTGQPQLNFSANVAINTARKRWSVLDADSYRSVMTGFWGADSRAVAALGQSNTNWQREVLRTSLSHDYNLSVGGKAGFLPYRVAGAYTDNSGILKDSRARRIAAGFNLTPTFFDGLLMVHASMKGYYVRNVITDVGAVGAAISFDPTQSLYSNIASGNSDYPLLYNGYTTSTTAGNAFNPNATLNPLAAIKDRSDIADIYRSLGNLQLDYAFHFLPDLHVNLNLGYDVSKSEENISLAANSPTAWASYVQNGAGINYTLYELRRNTLFDFYLNYKRDFERIESSLDLMAGYSWQRFDAHGRNNGAVYTTAGFLPLSTTDGVLTVNPQTQAGESYRAPADWNTGRLQLISFFGRMNYAYKDTYLLTFTLRNDGTSRFARDNRWGLFPALALAWKIGNMPFMEGVSQNVNDLKLRASWGVTGQQSIGGYFPYMALYQGSLIGSYYPDMYTGEPNGLTLYPVGYNPNLKWEETTTWNVGLDLGLWNNRLTFALDWYQRKSRDLLSFVTVAPGSVTTNILAQNIGTLRNVGLEATVGARVVDLPRFRWNTSVNVAWNSNKITKLNDTDNPNAYITTGAISGGTGNTVMAHKVGYPAYTFLLFQQVYDSSGLPIEGQYVDQNGDGTIDDNDRVFRHSKEPKVTLAWHNSFSYKNWDFSFQLRASIGNYVYNDVAATHSTLSSTFTNGAPSNLIKSDFYFRGDQTTNTYLSDYWLRNAGFLRCDHITIGYTWPSLLDNSLRLRLYGAVQNPFVISAYKGADPEVFGGIDNNVYPRPVSISIGLLATF